MRTTRLILAGACLVLSAAPLWAQAKPGPEHELFKQFEGDWDATIALGGMESKGGVSYKIGYGGFWLTEEFRGEFGGQKFEGRGTLGYDPFKKKYVATWIDSMSPSVIVLEGKYDKDARMFTETGEGTGMDGKLMKMKNVYEFKDKDTIVFTMNGINNDGKEEPMFKITYKRKK